jgi:hypothetical protein
MSEPSLTMPRSILKAFLDYIPDSMRHDIPAPLLELAYTPTSTDTAAKPRRRVPQTDPDTYSPIEHTLYSVQQFGFTHPSTGRFLMAPKEFQAILALETKAVADVIWELMQQTIAWTDGREPGGRREWARLSVRHFEREKIASRSQAEAGIKRALAMGYIERRRSGARGYEYRLRWKGTN